MTASEYLKILDGEFGVSGSEGKVAQCVKKLFSEFCDEITTDNLGNVIGIKKGTNPSSPSLMIEAHMDELGLMVSGITDEGSLKFVSIGGFDAKILPGTEVTVWGEEKLFGVIGFMPPHLIADRTKAVKLDELCVDIGFSKEITEKKVSVGDIITFNTGFTQLDSTMVASRCIDDRGGLAAVLRTLELLCGKNIENDIIAVATVQEEVGLRGAKTAAAHIKPSCAIALDVCHGTSLDVSEEAFPCGKGPVISIGPNLHSKMTRRIIDLAKCNNIDFQIEVCQSNTGTDAWEIQVSGAGVPTALLSVPVRYMHGNFEVADTLDMESAAKLISEFAVSLKEGDCLCW
ncbi:MAG: M20/M25/M40 family metallo-hydrolase [Clostridia bacterium]|nr:M20/M25/M40 family metallo-hydrolase [Clostridia bacterium]